MLVTYRKKNCPLLYDQFVNTILQYNYQAPNGGLYAIRRKDPVKQVLWLWRETISRDVTHSIEFVFTNKDGDCLVAGRSLGIDDEDNDDNDDVNDDDLRVRDADFDHYENYCNVWTPMKFTDSYVDERVGQCTSVPSSPANYCVLN